MIIQQAIPLYTDTQTNIRTDSSSKALKTISLTFSECFTFSVAATIADILYQRFAVPKTSRRFLQVLKIIFFDWKMKVIFLGLPA